VITLGIDLAAADANTGACSIRWMPGRAVAEIACGHDDEALLALIKTADKTGIDVPFGWPEDFVAAVTRYHGGGRWSCESERGLKFRATDLDVAARAGREPLSVSSQLIAIPAMRAARLFTRLASVGMPVDRSGAGALVEVYPAAALKLWGLPFTRYKLGKGAAVRRTLLDALRARTGDWLALDETACTTCLRSADALDALVAALVARASALGLCEAPPPEQLPLARREGWIALPPVDALERLVRG
jgi:predicted nuclease with RNAse H fold